MGGPKQRRQEQEQPESVLRVEEEIDQARLVGGPVRRTLTGGLLDNVSCQCGGAVAEFNIGDHTPRLFGGRLANAKADARFGDQGESELSRSGSALRIEEVSLAELE